MATVAAVKVTVSAGPPLNTALHGLVVPEQVEELRFAWPLQPANVDPLPALALNVTVAPLSEVVILGTHVLVTVCELAPVPVPPHEVGALTVPVLGVIVTEPVPVNVRTKLRASLNAVCAVKPDD
ncbi:MAG TPA: hypothetical protein VEQ38_15675 [Verrucomicrobiae bacterium]|nr:hypothetical protein [Verrucomicrobiae bacterium]